MISIVIPTQRRPGGLETAMRSAFAQTGIDPAGVELVVVDNDLVASARATIDRVCAEAPFAVTYVHEPDPGVANARNAALAAARGDYIAFLDDDEEAPEAWLKSLVETQAIFQADVVFGPVRGRAPRDVTRHRDYLERFFSRLGPEQSGLLDRHYGCGNSLLRRDSLPDRNRPFSPVRNFIGGEDDMLFGTMMANGARFAWSAEAWVWEDPVPERLTLSYTIRRSFAYGQGPSSACAAASPPDRVGIARWMVIGFFQAAAYGALAGFKAILGARDYAQTLDRAAQGLGKLLWWSRFKIHFYGLRPAP